MSGAVKKTRAHEVVAESWGDSPPDYIVALADACMLANSQRKIADRLGYSPTVVSTVLANKYTADFTAIEERVKAVLMADTVDCPGVGQEIDLATCLEHQQHAKSKNRSSAFRISMMRACNGCPKSRLGGK